MGLQRIDRGSLESSDDLATLLQVMDTFAKHRSPQIMMVGLVVVGALRLVVGGGFGWADVAVLAITLVFTGVVEWVLHLFLLHAPEDSARMKKLNTGAGHREHHLDPSNVGWLMLGWVEVVVFQLMLAVWNLTWPLALAFAFGAPLLGTYLSALFLAYVMLAHYEWTHLLVHTRYRPKTRYYRRLAKNHRLHHYRNEHHWLGVTSNVGDRLLRTLPASKSDVPLSDTARTL